MIRGIAKVLASGLVKQLDGKAEPEQIVTEADVQQPSKLARLLTSILRDLAGLKRRPYLRRIDYEDQSVTAGGSLTLAHRLNARVRWWAVDWSPAVSGNTCQLEKLGTSDAFALVLKSANAGTVSVRVEEAG